MKIQFKKRKKKWWNGGHKLVIDIHGEGGSLYSLMYIANYCHAKGLSKWWWSLCLCNVIILTLNKSFGGLFDDIITLMIMNYLLCERIQN